MSEAQPWVWYGIAASVIVMLPILVYVWRCERKHSREAKARKLSRRRG